MTDPTSRPAGHPLPPGPPASLPPDAPPTPPPGPPGSPFAGPPATAGSTVPRALVLVLAPVLAVVMFAGGVLVGRTGEGLAEPGATAAPIGADADLALIGEAWRAIQDNYVDAGNLDDRELAYGAIRGMTEAVGDEGHTTFLTAEESRAVDQSLSGTFVGVGVQVAEDDDGSVTITSVIKGTPAEEAGLRRGDRIIAVDGGSTEGESLDEVVSRVRGPEGEPVTLTIARGGEELEVTMTRRSFDLPLISWAMVPGRSVAMIRLEQFATGATKALKEAIVAARTEGATAILLDLRGNPGGYVNEAIGVTSQFLGDGIVYQALDAQGTRKDAEVEPGGLATDVPLVVLADGETASSAEIVSGAIQDAERGLVVGERTFGTGTVLGRFDLSDGSSLRIGVERWLTREGRPIWHEGLEPDVTVELPASQDPLLPDDLRDLSAAELARSEDAQVLRALEALEELEELERAG